MSSISRADSTVIPRKQRGRGWLFAVLGIIALAFFMLVAWFVLGFSYGIDDGYALWGAADMVIDYMESHDGRWPRGWDDLEPRFNAGDGRVGGWSLDQFKRRIVIDFDVDPDRLHQQSLQSSATTFDVIRPRWDFHVRVGGSANERLHDYFRQKAGIGPPPSDPHGPRAVPTTSGGRSE